MQKILITGSRGSLAVVQSLAKVKTPHADVTDAFIRGAGFALSLAQQHQIKIAVLKAGSPSCGNEQIYDGSFSAKKISGQGVTAPLLKKKGVRVFNEDQIDLVEQKLGE